MPYGAISCRCYEHHEKLSFLKKVNASTNPRESEFLDTLLWLRCNSLRDAIVDCGRFLLRADEALSALPSNLRSEECLDTHGAVILGILAREGATGVPIQSHGAWKKLRNSLVSEGWVPWGKCSDTLLTLRGLFSSASARIFHCLLDETSSHFQPFWDELMEAVFSLLEVASHRQPPIENELREATRDCLMFWEVLTKRFSDTFKEQEGFPNSVQKRIAKHASLLFDLIAQANLRASDGWEQFTKVIGNFADNIKGKRDEEAQEKLGQIADRLHKFSEQEIDPNRRTYFERELSVLMPRLQARLTASPRGIMLEDDRKCKVRLRKPEGNSERSGTIANVCKARYRGFGLVDLEGVSVRKNYDGDTGKTGVKSSENFDWRHVEVEVQGKPGEYVKITGIDIELTFTQAGKKHTLQFPCGIVRAWPSSESNGHRHLDGFAVLAEPSAVSNDESWLAWCDYVKGLPETGGRYKA